MKVTYNSPVGRSLGKKLYKGEYVGIELEYEECKGSVSSISPAWYTDIDHSLRTGGIEFITQPIQRHHVHDIVESMVMAAKGVKAKVTPRCGLHVHVNVTDLTWNELYRFTTLYTLLEPHLFNEWAPGREISHFCVPTWTNTALTEFMYVDGQKLRNGIQIPGTTGSPSWAKAAAYLSKGNSMGRRAELSILSTPKYAALNMAALKKFGTLEFRQAPSSLSVKFIEDWTNLLLDIREAALEYNDATEIVKDYDRRGILTLCEKVNFYPRGMVDELDQEDAVDAATVMAGHLPVNWKNLKWEIK
jgi:hypothetical protein